MKPEALLRSIPFFTALEDGDLARIAAATDRCELAAGERLFEEGDAADSAYVITSGQLEILKRSAEREVLLAVRGSGDVIGEMALLEDAPRMASAKARTEITLLAVPRLAFEHVLETSPAAARGLFSILLARWRETEARLRQREQLAQLGTLSAGLAHELNNPAAAAKRAAAGIPVAAARLAEAAARFRAIETPEAASLADRLAEAESQRLSSLARSDRRDGLADRLRAIGVPGAGSLTATLADLDTTTVDEVLTDAQGLEPELAAAVLSLAVARREVESLAAVTLDAATRISDIVGAVKSYAFTGRAPIQEVDVEKMLDNTFVLLAHKVGEIEVIRDYAGVPPLQAYGSELSQLWTNLVDNAVDAIAEAGRSPGTISVRTRVEDDRVVVELEDDGPGIPAEVLPRVFDSFFTTKPPGSGTGLGLDISYGIVVHRHGGEIDIDSEPGRTRVRVQLPLEGPEA